MNTKQFSAVFLIPALIIILCGSSQAATYYVSTSGSATWSSCINISTPCSWQTAMANALAGDLVYFRGGTYNLGTFDNDDYSMVGNTRMYPANSGTAGNPITFIAYPGETPDITGTVTSTSQEAWFGCGQASYDNISLNKNYITWDGFSATMQVNNVDPNQHFETAIFRVAGDHCTIRNSNFTGVDVVDWPYNTTFVRIEAASNALIENNYFHGLISVSTSAVNTAAIYFHSTNDDTIIRNNTIEDCEGGVYSKGRPATVYVYNNFIYNSSGNGYLGIWYKRSNPAGAPLSASKQIIYQNVILKYNTAIWFEDGGVAVANSKIYNNTIYSSGGADDGIQIDLNHTNTEVFNNIISGRVPYLRYANGTVSYSDYNDFYNVSGNSWSCGYSSSYTSLATWIASGVACRPADYDDNSIVANPLFVNANGSSPEDYRLQSTSSAISAGIDRQDYDSDGNVTESIDMGAYPRRLGDRIGYRPQQRPAAPTNLQ